MNRTTLKSDASLIGKLIGVEIEYYPTSGAADVSSTAATSTEALVNVVTDGSLAGGGKEIRVLSLVSPDGRIKDLLDLKIEGRVDKTCGVHVHVDARHLGQNGLLSAEETYDRLANNKVMNYVFKKLVPKSRHSNRYCRWRSNRGYGRTRYSAFNFLSFREHGTIEFRMQGGSTNRTKIETWALICAFVLNYVADSANEMPTSWSTFLKIMPEPLRTWCALRRASLHGTDGFEINLTHRIMEALVQE
jgi:hypothetical protein